MAAGRDFYGRLFGRPADVVVTDDDLIWRLVESTWPYVVVDTGHTGNALATLSVGDLDATLAELGERGMSSASMEVIAGARHKATVLDPDRNSVAILAVTG